MRKIIAAEFITLDGVIQAPGDPNEDTSGDFKYGGWIAPYMDDFSGEIMKEQTSLDNTELLLGQKTYEIFASYWPQRAETWTGINEVTKYVVSNDSSFNPSWENSVVLSGDVIEKIQEIKNKEGPRIVVWGSGNLLQSLFKHKLVDELWLKIFPVTLGQGKRLFAEGTTPTAFKLTETKISPKGVIFANYERAGEVQTGSVA